jgi:hypothetical protein
VYRIRDGERTFIRRQEEDIHKAAFAYLVWWEGEDRVEDFKSDETVRYERVLRTLEEVRRDNREKEDELTKLRPLARLATLLSLCEGENERRFSEMRKWDREWEDVKVRYLELENRMREVESAVGRLFGRRLLVVSEKDAPPPGGGVHPQ